MNERWGVPASAGRERDWPQELVLPIALAGGGGDAAVHTHQAIDPTAELVRLTDTMQKLVVIDFEGDGDLGIMFSLRAAGIVVDEICEDSCSAEETGLHVGMVLREVDGEPTSVLGFRRAMFHLGEAWRTRNAVELAFMPTGAHEVRAWLASLDCEEYCSTFEIFGVGQAKPSQAKPADPTRPDLPVHTAATHIMTAVASACNVRVSGFADGRLVIRRRGGPPCDGSAACSGAESSPGDPSAVPALLSHERRCGGCWWA
jgi:hypothetical protein